MADRADEPITVPRGYVDRLRWGWVVLAVLNAALSAGLIAAAVVSSTALIVLGSIGLAVWVGVMVVTLLR